MELKHKLRFLSVGGINNFRTFAETKMIKELGVPAFYVTDGDVPQGLRGKGIKNKIMKDLQIREKHFMWIPKEQIDDYILDPHLICLAFQEHNLDERIINDFITHSKGKTSKEILRDIFRSYIPGQSYIPENARKIASKFDKHNVPEDLVSLIKNICMMALL